MFLEAVLHMCKCFLYVVKVCGIVKFALNWKLW